MAQEAKENWFVDTVLLVGGSGSSSHSPAISSGMELVVQEEAPLADLEAMHEEEEERGGGARALETSRAEALQDLDRNSIGARGLSGNWVPPRGVGPARREFFGRSVTSMRVSGGLGGFSIWWDFGFVMRVLYYIGRHWVWKFVFFGCIL